MKTNLFLLLNGLLLAAFPMASLTAAPSFQSAPLTTLMLAANDAVSHVSGAEPPPVKSEYTTPIKVLSTVGDVSVLFPDGSTHPIKVGEVLPVGVKIVTGSGGQIALSFMTGITAVVGPNSKTSIIQSDFNPSGNKRDVTLYLDHGQIIPNVIKQPGPTNVTIITPSGDKYSTDAGIASVSYADGTTSIQVAQGDGTYTSSTGETVPINSGSQISATTADGTTTVSQVSQVDPQTIETIDSIVQVAILSGDLSNNTPEDTSNATVPFNPQSSSANPANAGGAGRQTLSQNQ